MNANGSGVIEKQKERKMNTPEEIKKWQEAGGYIIELPSGKWQSHLNLRSTGNHTLTIEGTYEKAVLAHEKFVTKWKENKNQKDLTLKELFELSNTDKDFAKNQKDADREYAARLFVEFFGEDFLAKDLEDYSEDPDQKSLRKYEVWRRENNLQNSSINKELRILNAVYNWGVKNLKKRKFAKPFIIEYLKEKKRPIKSFTSEEYQEFLNVSGQDQKDFCEVVLLTGGSRRKQIETLTWDQVDLKNLKITVKNKNRKYEEEIIEKEFHPDLLKIFERRKKKSFVYVFPSKRDLNKPCDFYDSFKVAVKKIGCEWANVHTLRKTWDSWGKEVDGAAAASMAGHSLQVATNHYMEVTQKERSNVMDFVGNKRKAV
jgi:integrase